MKGRFPKPPQTYKSQMCIKKNTFPNTVKNQTYSLSELWDD